MPRISSIIGLLFLSFTLGAQVGDPLDLPSSGGRKRSLRIAAYGRFGNNGFYPQGALQFQVGKNSFLHASVGFGSRARVTREMTYYYDAGINAYSPDKAFSYAHCPETSTGTIPTLFDGLIEGVDFSYSTLTGFLHYQLLIIGYRTKQYKAYLLVDPGVSYSLADQKGKNYFKNSSGAELYSSFGNCKFYSMGADLGLEGMLEHRSGIGLRLGFRGTFGFPEVFINRDENEYLGTQEVNPFVGLWWEGFFGLSFRIL